MLVSDASSRMISASVADRRPTRAHPAGRQVTQQLGEVVSPRSLGWTPASTFRAFEDSAVPITRPFPRVPTPRPPCPARNVLPAARDSDTDLGAPRRRERVERDGGLATRSAPSRS